MSKADEFFEVADKSIHAAIKWKFQDHHQQPSQVAAISKEVSLKKQARALEKKLHEAKRGSSGGINSTGDGGSTHA